MFLSFLLNYCVIPWSNGVSDRETAVHEAPEDTQIGRCVENDKEGGVSCSTLLAYLDAAIKDRPRKGR